MEAYVTLADGESVHTRENVIKESNEIIDTMIVFQWVWVIEG